MIGQIISHYRILAKLGEGGMGVVYLAEDTKLERKVAIKFLPRHIAANDEERERFKIEAKAAAALNHPNIATIYAIEEHDDEMFIVMEYIEGRELREIIGAPLVGAQNRADTRPAPTRDEIINYATQIAKGLQAAHEKGIVHRDIKSTNIMVTDKGQIKIMDFGLAKIGGGVQMTKDHSTLGTAAYMSPEQARGEPVDHRTDIWAFGVVLYEMLTGRLPFGGEYEQAVIYSILNEEPESPAEIPPALKAVLQKALQKDVSKRYLDSGKLVEELKGISGGNQPKFTSGKAKQQSKNLKYLFVGFAIIAIMVVALMFLRPSHPENQAIDSIAVLPLKNLSGDSSQDYFADGMTEALITDLSKIRTLKVISRTSVMQFKNTERSLPEIAVALGVKAVVEGSVIRDGNQVRITAQLIEAATDEHLWAESYDRNMTNILSLQREIALAVVSQIKTVLSPEEKNRLTAADSVDPIAHENYLKGLHHLHTDTEEDLLRSIAYFNRTVAIAPTYVMAYVGLADAYQRITSNGFMASAEGYPKAIAAVNRALELEPDLNEAHLSLARIKFTLEWDWDGAEREFLRVLEQNPNSAKGHERYAIFLVIMRRFEEANREILKARELDPLSAWINDNIGWIYYFQRRYEEALVEYQKTIEMYPDFTMAYHEQSLVYIALGIPNQAIEAARKAVSIIPDDPYNVTYLGQAYAMAGEREKAEEIIEQIMERAKTKAIPLYELGLIYAALGDNDKAFYYLEQSYEKKSSWPFIIRIDPAADILRSDPRYIPFVRKFGLEP